MCDRPGDLLSRVCSNAHSLVIAVPYIKVDALSRVLAVINAEASVICVTRWNPHDLAVGASDAEARDLVMDFGGSFRLHPTLHAKYYRIDDVTLIGSANLTPSAMGWSRQPNLEILSPAGDEFDSLAFQQNLLSGSREISDDEFLRWDAIAKIAGRAQGDAVALAPRLNAWRPKTRDPIHLELSYKGRGDEIASLDEQMAARRDLQALLVPADLSNIEVRTWVTACLLATPFARDVIQLSQTTDVAGSYQSLARMYELNMTEARRDMETVQNWLTFLAPETVR